AAADPRVTDDHLAGAGVPEMELTPQLPRRANQHERRSIGKVYRDSVRRVRHRTPPTSRAPVALRPRAARTLPVRGATRLRRHGILPRDRPPRRSAAGATRRAAAWAGPPAPSSSHR